MKKMICLVMVVMALACSDKYRSVADSAVPFLISFNRDSVRIREKDDTNILFTSNGKLTIYLKDADHQLTLVREDTNTAIHVRYRGTDILPGKPLPVADSIEVFISADQPDLFALAFTLTDRLGRMITRTLPVRVIANQAATPNFFYQREEPSSLQSWPYQLNASPSSDPDGLISKYHFLINGQLVESGDPVVRWIFRAKGEQVVGLYVTDDLGLVSATVYQKILIP